MNNETINESIFHYTNLEGLKGIISDQALWLTHCHFLNDPYELKCTHLSEKKDLSLILLEMFPDSFIPFISSFSLDPDSYSLWSNYTNHFGFNIEFDIKKLYLNFVNFKEKNQNEKFPNFFLNDEMIYSQDIQEKITDIITARNHTLWKRVFNDLLEKHPELKKSNASEAIRIMALNKNYANEILKNAKFDDLFKNLAELYHKIVFFKSNCFSAEQEYRFAFIFHIRNVTNFIKFRQKDNFLIPFIKIPINLNYKTLNPIKSITLGPKSKTNLHKNSLDLFLKFMKINLNIKESSICLQ